MTDEVLQLTKEEIATLLWTLDSKMDSLMTSPVEDVDTLIMQRKLYEQVSTLYNKLYVIWKSDGR